MSERVQISQNNRDPPSWPPVGLPPFAGLANRESKRRGFFKLQPTGGPLKPAPRTRKESASRASRAAG